MFDIGWGELFLIGVVALIVVGPKELPGLFRTVGVMTGKARAMARDFQRTLEQAADESGMSEVSKSLQSLERMNLTSPSAAARTYAARTATGAVLGSEAAKADPGAAPAVMTQAAATAAPDPAAGSAPGTMAPATIGTPTPVAAAPVSPAPVPPAAVSGDPAVAAAPDDTKSAAS